MPEVDVAEEQRKIEKEKNAQRRKLKDGKWKKNVKSKNDVMPLQLTKRIWMQKLGRVGMRWICATKP